MSIKTIFILAIFPALVFSQPRVATDGNRTVHTAQKTTNLEPDGTLININRISMWVYANGESARHPDGTAPHVCRG